MTAEGIFSALARAASDLSELGVRHALVGGLAVSVRAGVMERGFDRGEPLLDRWRAITGQG